MTLVFSSLGLIPSKLIQTLLRWVAAITARFAVLPTLIVLVAAVQSVLLPANVKLLLRISTPESVTSSLSCTDNTLLVDSIQVWRTDADSTVHSSKTAGVLRSAMIEAVDTCTHMYTRGHRHVRA